MLSQRVREWICTGMIFSSFFLFLEVPSYGVNLSPEERAEITQKFWTKKRYERAQSACSSIGVLGVGGYVAYCSGNNVAFGLGLSPFLIPLATSALGKLSRDLVLYTPLERFFPPSYVNQLKKFDELELRFELRKSDYSEGDRVRIREKIDRLKGSLERSMTSSSSSAGDDAHFEKLELILNLPIESKSVSMGSFRRVELDDYLSTFEKPVRDFILLSSFQIAENSQLHDRLTERDESQKTTLYFVGEGGTGKTSTVRAMSKILGLPLCQISLGGIEPGQLNGSYSNGPETKAGKIAQCLGMPKLDNQTYLNTIIFLDEVHDVLNGDRDQARRFLAILKDLLEPDQKTFKDEALGLDLDVSRVIFILAGNETISEHLKSNPFKSRYSTLVFPKISLPNRHAIAMKTAEKVAKNSNYELSSIDLGLIERLASADPNDGVRVLKSVIREYIHFQKTKTVDWFTFDEKFQWKESFLRNGSVEWTEIE